jgi:hypothetical protein
MFRNRFWMSLVVTVPVLASRHIGRCSILAGVLGA